MLRKDDKIQKKSFPYDFPVELETRAHGSVVARCPLLPGCQAQGPTPKEALERLRAVLDLYFTTAAPALFESLESFPEVPTLYDLAEFKGFLYAASGRDQVFRTSSGAPGSWKGLPVTRMQTKFFTPAGGKKEKEGAGDYSTQVYCLCAYAPPGREAALYAGTNLNGAVYATTDGEKWRDAFSTGEDRIHALCEFKGRLYAGTSSQGKVFAFDGTQWNNVGSLSEVAVTCLGVFGDRLYAGTYPSGLLFSTRDGLNWEEAAATGQNFIQCFKEFDGHLYAGTSGPKGVKVYRTQNGRDWAVAYESGREQNLYCLEVFENALYAGTGNSGRILKTLDGLRWTTAYAGDEEGVRAFGLFGDYLFACTENNGAVLRSTFDMARLPEVTDLRVEKASSCSATLAWTTDIPSTSEVHYGEKGDEGAFRRVVMDKAPETRHRVHLTDLKAETEYEFKAVSAHRTSSLSVTEVSSFRTEPVEPPSVASASHPQPGKWEKQDNVEVLLHPSRHLTGYYYLLNRYPETVPAPPEASYTEEKRIALASVGQGSWYFHVAGVDEAGNIGTRAAHYRVLVDTEALPPPSLSSPTHPDPEKWVANPTPIVEWEAPQDLSGVKGYFVKVDREPSTVPGPGTGDFTKETRLTLGPLEDGLWYVHVSTQDEAGNAGGRAAHYPLKIDTQALVPALSSPSHPRPGQWYSRSTLEVSLAAPHDLSGVEGYYYLIDREPQTLPYPESAAWTVEPSISFPDLADGAWYVHVRTKDRAENLSAQAGHLEARIDTQAAPPSVSSPTHPETGRWYKDRRVVVNWEDPSEHSGVEGFYYAIDRKSDTVPGESALFTEKRTVSFELAEDGVWYFHVATRDRAGNLDRKAAHFPLRVDTEVGKPHIASPTHPEPDHWYPATRALFRLSPPEDLSGVTGYYYTFSEDPQAAPDPGEPGEGSPSATSFTDQREIALDIPRDGVHYLSVVCRDGAGNLTAAPALYRVKLDTSAAPPEIASPTHGMPEKWYASRRVELTWKDPSDASGIEGYYYLFNREEGWVPEIGRMAWTTGRGTVFNLAEDGVWFAHVCAKDRAGNISEPARFKLRVDSQVLPPVVKSSTHPPNHWVKTSAPAFSWEAPPDLSGVEGYYYALDDQPHTIPGPGNGQWTTGTSLTAPPLKDGKWWFHLAAKDRTGNLGKEAAHYALLIDTAPPKSQMKSLAPILDRTQVYVEWSALDPHSGAASFDVQVKVDGGAWTDWLSGVPENSGTYPGQDGRRYAFRCRARDGAGNLEDYPEAEGAFTRVDISPPPAVTQLKASPRAGGDIELKWTPVEDRVSGTAYYRIYRWTEGEPRARVCGDGEVAEGSFLDRGESLRENKVYYYCVQAVDRMGNEQHEGNAVTASLSDHGVGTPQVTSPTHSSDDWSSKASAILVWDAPADATGIAGYYYTLDQSPSSLPSPGSATFVDGRRVELADLESGVWYFHLVARDRAGNVSTQAGYYRLKIDVDKPAPPQVSSDSHPDSQRWYSANKAEFRLSAAPKLSGLDCFYYAFDRQPGTVPLPAEAQRSTEEILSLKASEPGVWYLHAAVKDKAGNLSEPTHFQVRVAAGEVPPPLVSSPTHPEEDEPVSLPDPLFTWDDRHDGSFKPAGYVYKLSPREDETLTAEDAFTTERSVQMRDVAEGTWYFHIAAVGKKGKPGSLASKRRVRIQRVGKVYGTFLRKDGVTPFAGAKVEVVRGEKAAATVSTDSKGRFHFSGLPEGRYEVRLHSDQFPVLRIKDVAVSPTEGLEDGLFTEDLGVFPNPPQPGPVRFYYFLKEDCNVTLEVFDSTGAMVGKMEERKEGGAYNVTLWDAAGRGEGEYLYKLSAKSVTKNAISRFSVKKFRLQKAARVLEAQPI